MKVDGELLVGVLLLGIVAGLGYMSIQLGQIELGSGRYPVYADCINAGGLQDGAVIELAGVEIGRVESVILADYKARVTLKIRGDIPLQEDAQAAIKTKGLIGERYVAIIPGHSSTILAPGGTIDKTEESVDIQQLLGEFIFGDVGATTTPENTSSDSADPSDPWTLDLD